LPRSNASTRAAARDILKIVPLVMRTVAAQLRAGGDMPAPAHYGLLSILRRQPRTLTELAAIQGVSLPTMSNSVATLVQRGWVKRSSPPRDRRVVLLRVTPLGRATVERVGRVVEAHLALMLTDLDEASRRRLQDGLAVLRRAFAGEPGEPERRTTLAEPRATAAERRDAAARRTSRSASRTRR
jgi:DNA-binding MarR family transcriptional regulator